MTERSNSPGEAVKAELEKRSWTQQDLAKVLGKHQPYINEIIQDKRSISPEMAMALSAAFAKPADYWLSLDAKFRLSLLEPNTEVERRARLYSLAPIKDMERRGWIKPSDSLDAMEKELCRFYNVDSLDAEPLIHVNTRRSLRTANLTNSQVAWCMRAARLAPVVDASRFKDEALESALPEIRRLCDYPEKTKHVPRVLSEIGVRFLIVEPLPNSRIDGAAFWLADDAPVVVLSARFDRIDCFWHTFFHELSHIRHRDSQSIDSQMVGEERAAKDDFIENRADSDAVNTLLSGEAVDSFILRVKPFYSKQKIVQFAIRMRVHPGIVVGQLQHRGEIPWGANREMLAKVRDIATSTALTDGWGATGPAL